MILFHVMMASLTLFAADLELGGSIYVDDDDVVTPFAVHDNGADGASISDEVEVYIPFQSGTAGVGGAAEVNASYYSELPYIDSVNVFDGADGKNPCLSFYVTSKQTEPGITKLHFTVEDDSTYYPIAFSTTSCADAISSTSTTHTLSNGSSTWVYVEWKNFAQANGTLSTIAWDDDDSEISYNAYLFLSDRVQDDFPDDDLDEDDYDKGLFFTFKFSADEPTDIAVLSNLAKGDTALTLSYDASEVEGNDLDQMMVISAYAPVTSGRSWRAFLASPGGEVIPNSADTEIKGEFKLTGLTNDKRYYITLSARDVFYFMSPLPATLENTPQELKAFIQEKSCYLLSAGFQTDHPVLEFFRQWRDQKLSHYSLGKKFIHWYYATAPQYTQIIIDHPALAGSVRTAGYVAYGLVRYFWWWIGALVAIIGFIPLSRFRMGSYR